MTVSTKVSPCGVLLVCLLAAIICSLPNDTFLDPLGTGDVVDPVEWEGPVSIAALAPPTDCFETTRDAEG